MDGKESDSPVFVKWFSELNRNDSGLAGVKGANLGEISNSKFPVPPGFVITSEAYDYFIEKNKLAGHIEDALKSINIHDAGALGKNASRIRHMIENAEIPKEMRVAILDAYDVLDVNKSKLVGASEGALDILRAGHEPPFVAVRSSGTVENVEDENFPQKHGNFLNVKGEIDLIRDIKKVFSSLYQPKAILYRDEKSLSSEKFSMAVIVQRMVDSNKSGNVFSKDGFGGGIAIEAIFGLGEGRFTESVQPDSYSVSSDLELVGKKIGDKRVAVARNSSGNRTVIQLESSVRRRDVLTGHEVKMLSQYAQRLEEHFGEPQDVEFAIDSDQIYVVQTKPIVYEYEKDETPVEVNEKSGEVEKAMTEGIEVRAGDICSLAEEDRVLKALEEEKRIEEEYRPSSQKRESDIPELNEAIPISSEEFEPEKEEIIEVEADEEDDPEEPLQPAIPEVIEPEPAGEGLVEPVKSEVTNGEPDSQVIDASSQDSEIDEMLPQEDIEKEERSVAFEEQLDAIFEKEVEIEVEESEERSEAIAQVTGQKPPQVGDGPSGGEEGSEEKDDGKKEQVLDIF